MTASTTDICGLFIFHTIAADSAADIWCLLNWSSSPPPHCYFCTALWPLCHRRDSGSSWSDRNAFTRVDWRHTSSAVSVAGPIRFRSAPGVGPQSRQTISSCTMPSASAYNRNLNIILSFTTSSTLPGVALSVWKINKIWICCRWGSGSQIIQDYRYFVDVKLLYILILFSFVNFNFTAN